MRFFFAQISYISENSYNSRKIRINTFFFVSTSLPFNSVLFYFRWSCCHWPWYWSSQRSATQNQRLMKLDHTVTGQEDSYLFRFRKNVRTVSACLLNILISRWTKIYLFNVLDLIIEEWSFLNQWSRFIL